MLRTIQELDQSLAGLHYTETQVDWNDLEHGLSIVSPVDDKGPPDFFLTLPGWTNNLPLSRLAAGQFGRLSGVKPGIYKEFVRNAPLTAQMIHYSMSRSDRGGSAYVAYTPHQVVGVYSSEKPFLGLKTAYDILFTAPGVRFGDMFINSEGTFEFVAVQGDLTSSTTPGLYMLHGGRPTFGTLVVLHDHSYVISPLKAAKQRKSREACQIAAARFVEAKTNEAMGEARQIYSLASQSVSDVQRFLSRMALGNKFSTQSMEHLLKGSAERFNSLTPSLYEVVHFVASLASDGGVESRRFQSLAYTLAFHGCRVCTSCGYAV